MKTKKDYNITIRFKENQYIIKLFEGTSKRYRSWIIPEHIFKDIINWYKKKKSSKIDSKIDNIIEETNLCKFNLEFNWLYIKRKDIYLMIHYTLPVKVLNYLINKF